MKNLYEELVNEMETQDEEQDILNDIKTANQKNKRRDLKELLSKGKLNKFELEEYMLE
ncbi:hypothetical protein J4232_00720 [Candidatus Woesearchaeota archaeon]|nr:hypothetical protein [Candidatus Woesearchaeota archaeon]